MLLQCYWNVFQHFCNVAILQYFCNISVLYGSRIIDATLKQEDWKIMINISQEQNELKWEEKSSLILQFSQYLTRLIAKN